MSWPWTSAHVVLHDHVEGADCTDRCVEIPARQETTNEHEARPQ
jgi:hypothetical protein